MLELMAAAVHVESCRCTKENDDRNAGVVARDAREFKSVAMDPGELLSGARPVPWAAKSAVATTLVHRGGGISQLFEPITTKALKKESATGELLL